MAIKTPAEKYKQLVKIFIRRMSKDVDNIKHSVAGVYARSAISILMASDLETIKDTKKNMDLIVSEYKRYKSSEVTSTKDIVNNSKYLNQEYKRINLELSATKAKRRKIRLKAELADIKQKRIDNVNSIRDIKNKFKISDDIINKVSGFLKSQNGVKINDNYIRLTDIQNIDSVSRRKDLLKKGALGGLAALTKSSIPLLIPRGIKGIKEGWKNFNNNSKSGKASLLGAGLLGGLGILAGSPAAMMGAAYLKGKSNEHLQKKNDFSEQIKRINSNILREQLNHKRDPSRTASKTNSFEEALIQSLEKSHPGIRKELRPALRGHKHGGTFQTIGPTRIGNHDIAGEAGPETIKIIPKGKDPVVTSIEKTNSILNDMRHSQEESAIKVGLANKDKNEKLDVKATSNVFGSAITKNTKGETGLLTTLLEAEFLTPILAPLITSVANVAKPLLLKSVSMAGRGLLRGAGIGAAGSAAYFGVTDAIKAVKTGKSTSNDYARKLGFVKSKEDIDSGTDSRSKWNPLSWAGRGIDTLAEGAAKLSVIITEDKSKTTADLLTKADENKTLMEKMNSIWSDPSKSPLQKLGGMFSSTMNSIGSGIKNIFPHKPAEFDVSKLKNGVGSVAEKYESGGRGAGTISSGSGDFGGKSYGTFQLSSKSGTLNSFLKQSPYAKEFNGLQPGSTEFDSKWKDLAKNDPGFGKAQHDYIAQTHAAPQMDKLKKLGLDTNSKALQEMAFSTGTQYGPDSNIIEEAIKASGKDPSKLSTKEVIDIVQDYKASTVGSKFKSSSPSVQAGVARRHGVDEKSDLMQIADYEAKVKPKNVQEGSIKNIKGNATNGSEGSNLTNKETATDAFANANAAKGTQAAINNTVLGGSTPTPPSPTPNIFTGDQISYATRLAKSY